MGKGTDNERAIVRRLDDWGFTPMRSPASGGGTDRDMPDVIWTGTDGDERRAVWTAEAKRGADEVEVRPHEIAALLRFSQPWSARVLLLSRFDYDTAQYVTELDEDYTSKLTDGGYFRLKRDDREQYPTLSEYLRIKG